MPTSRRVLYLAWAPFFSGAERALLMTLRSLDASQYEPYVLAGTHGEFAAQVRALGIQCDIVPITPLDRAKPFSSSLSVARVAAAALRFRPSIIHANDMPSYQPGGYAARRYFPAPPASRLGSRASAGGRSHGGDPDYPEIHHG